MWIVRNEHEFLKVWYYKTAPIKKDMPKSYPCIVEVVDFTGGLGGGYVHHFITPIPKDVDPEHFLLGYKAGRDIDDRE